MEVQKIQESVLKVKEKFKEVLSEGRSRSRSRDSSIRTTSSQRGALEMKEALESSKARTVFTNKADALQQQLDLERECEENRRKEVENRRKEQEQTEENRQKEREQREETQRKLKHQETQNEVKRLRERGEVAALEAAIRVHEEEETQGNSFVADHDNVDRDSIHTFRRGPSSQLPDTSNLNSAQARSSPAVDNGGVGAATLGGSSIAMVHSAPEDNGTLASNLSNSVAFMEPGGRLSHPGRDSAVVAPPLSFSSPVVNQPGSGWPSSSVHPRVETKTTPCAAAAGVRQSHSSVGLPYVRKLGSQEVKKSPVHPSTPFWQITLRLIIRDLRLLPASSAHLLESH